MPNEIKLLQSSDGLFYANFNDIAINGDIQLINGKDKIRQEICKFILTQQGTAPLFPTYGTNIPFLMNNRTSNLIYNDLKNEIIYAIQWIQELNKNEDINIQNLEKLDMEIVNERQLNIRISLVLTDGEYLKIDETSNL